ncbi:glycosyltransferase, partial [bacterium]|nr:glycosyltransferase [bacterium]
MPSRTHSDKPVKILHITDQLSKGGAGRALIGVAKYSQRLGNYQHECISVKQLFDGVVSEGVTEGLKVHVAPPLEQIKDLIEQADIVQWHWWQDFPLMREALPEKPKIVWCAVSGEYPPNELTREVVDFADQMVITNPLTRDLPAIRSLPESERQRKVRLIFESADFERILPVERIPHDTFNVGWIGTIAEGKYNPRYVEMSSKISLPNVKFVVLGEGPLKEQAMRDAYRLGVLERFNFAGYQDDMRQVLGLFDVYGFPLDEKTFAGGELNLQEVMVAGLPIVVFPYGGPKRMILHNYNGLIANSEKEYKDHIEYLYYHPEERKRLGDNAREYALREFGAENAARKYNQLYDEMLVEQCQSVTVTETEIDSRKRLALFHQGKGHHDKAVSYARQYLLDHPDDQKMLQLVERNENADAIDNRTTVLFENPDEIERSIDTRVYPKYKVSAIVSTYNSADVFQGCIEDLLQQTLYKKGDLEIIIVDSASPQGEWSMVDAITADKQHILALRTKQRESLYAAWNRAIKLSSSPYLTNANADDRHRKDALEVLAAALDENPEAAIV